MTLSANRKGVIGLPANLFYGTGIPACIIVIDKESAASRMLKDPLDLGKTEGGIFMVDASKGFAKDGNKNRLRAQDIHKIVDVFTKQLELKGYSRLVSLKEIAGNDYNLNKIAQLQGVEVINLTPPGGEAHDLELSPQQVAEIGEADLILYIPGFQPALDEAIASFSLAYARQTEHDHEALDKARRSGRIRVASERLAK